MWFEAYRGWTAAVLSLVLCGACADAPGAGGSEGAADNGAVGAGASGGDGASGAADSGHEDHAEGTMDANAMPSMDGLDVPAEPIVCDLGTMYPDLPLIDPDNPDYEDAIYSKAQVKEAFAKDKADNGSAYRAYKAALQHQDVLACAFCACGCAPSIGHLSAIDCFKDMHGFG